MGSTYVCDGYSHSGVIKTDVFSSVEKHVFSSCGTFKCVRSRVLCVCMCVAYQRCMAICIRTTPSAEEPKTAELSAADILSEQIIPLLTYFAREDGKIR